MYQQNNLGFQNNPYSNPYMQRLEQMTAPQQQSVVEVNGINGANAYTIAPNSSVLLLDSNKPILYIKTADGAGYATVKAYDISEHHEEGQINLLNIEERLKKVEEKLNEQPVRKSVKSKSNDAENANG